MVGRDGRVQRCYEGKAEGSSEKTKQALNKYKVPIRLLCVRENG